MQTDNTLAPTFINISNGFATSFASNKLNCTFTGTIYDSNGKICTSAQRTLLGVNEWNPDDPTVVTPPSQMLYIKGRSLYLGHYTGHYGHFLIESLSRFWAINIHDASQYYDNFVFHPFLHKCPPFNKFPPAALAFDAFKLSTKNIILIDQPIGFENITVPASLFQINHEVHQDMSNVYQHLVHFAEYLQNTQNNSNKFFNLFRRKQPTKNRLYISRRRTKGYHPMQNEKEVESVFAKHGFYILHPEVFPYQNQLAMLSNASVLAGVEGSGLHNSVFMSKGNKVIQIGTPREPTGTIYNQKLCDRLSSVISYSIPFKGNITSGNKAIYDLNFIDQSLCEIL